MPKVLLISTLLLVLAAPVALAGGVNLAWGTLCYTEHSVVTTTFACDTNDPIGDRVMTASFMLDYDMPDMVGVEWRIVGQSDQQFLPDWWKLGEVPDCRTGQMAFNSDYTASESDICIDWTAGAGFNAPNYVWSGSQATITLGTAIDASTPFHAIAGQEYYAGGVKILNGQTVGPGACTGCSTGMLFVLDLLTVAGLDGRRDDFYFAPLTGGNYCLYWNNGHSVCPEEGGGLPARNTTWGQIKSLYR